MVPYSVIGKSVLRADGPVKATGEALYSTDIKLPDMLIGKIKRSPHPFAKMEYVKPPEIRIFKVWIDFKCFVIWIRLSYSVG